MKKVTKNIHDDDDGKDCFFFVNGNWKRNVHVFEQLIERKTSQPHIGFWKMDTIKGISQLLYLCSRYLAEY